MKIRAFFASVFRRSIWANPVDEDKEAGGMVSIWALTYEHHPVPELHSFKEPISVEQREKLLVGAAADRNFCAIRSENRAQRAMPLRIGQEIQEVRWREGTVALICSQTT